MSQKEFAEKVGVSQASINMWERGNRRPKFEQIQKIANALDMPISFFLEDELFDIMDLPVDEELGAIDEKIQNLSNDCTLSKSEKEKKIKDLANQLRLLANAHIERAISAEQYMKDAAKTAANALSEIAQAGLEGAEEHRENLLLYNYRQLNQKGQYEAVKRVQDLTYNPDYTKSTPTPSSVLVAAHNDHADDPEEQEKIQRDLDMLKKIDGQEK